VSYTLSMQDGSPIPSFITYDDTVRPLYEDWLTDRYMLIDVTDDGEDGRYEQEYCMELRLGLADYPNF